VEILNLAQAEKNIIHAELQINREWCKGCGICMAFCPKEALFLDEHGKAEKDSEKCIVCGVCETFCPDFAIVVVQRRVSINAGNKTGSHARQ
jgi:2-oxoglutarate ferredoxin oxidoreductase subunit delta